jgi:hypothetical protein
VSAYSTALRRFEDFCSEHSFPYPGFPSEAILLYIVQLVRLGVSFQVLANFKPSITYLDLTLGRPSSFTPFLDLVLHGAKRTAAASASPAKKAPAVTPDMLHIVLDKFYTPFARSVAEIPPARFRTLFRIVLEYHTLCRLNCFRQLQAKHFDIVGDSIMITFPSAKNDQFHQGRSSFLVPTSTPYCPVAITKAYFRRFGLRFGQESGDSSFVNFQLRHHAATLLPIFHRSLSASTATRDLRLLFAAAGLPGVPITDKSIKMAGVSAAFAAGASTEDVMHIGRWRTTEIPLRYKLNTAEFKKSMASKVPPLGDMRNPS